MNNPLLSTPLLEEHIALKARLVPFAGYQMPVQYSSILREHAAVREHAGLFDVSHMGELELIGSDALSFVDSLVTNDLLKLHNNQAAYALCCNQNGNVIDDLIIYKLSEIRVLVVCNAGNRTPIVEHFKKHLPNNIKLTDVSDEMALLALQGPKSFDILNAVAQTSFETPSRFFATQGRIASVDVLIARTGYTGEDGVEIFCQNQDASLIWRALLESGKAFGIEPCGLGARDTLRLEAALPLYGHELDLTTTPLEAGLVRWVKLNKPKFIGKEALIKQQANLSKQLVGFEMKGRGIARQGYQVFSGEKIIGIVTSGAPSPTLNKNIGLAYVTPAYISPGTSIQIDVRGSKIDAEVVSTPFYKRPR